MRSGWIVVASAALAVGIAPAATAGSTSESPASKPAIVHIFVVGTTAESVRPLVDVFSRRDSNLHLTHVPVFSAADVLAAGDPGVAARVWIEVAPTGQARITIADERAQRFLVREAALPTWPDEVARETVAQMVESSVTALLENQRLGMSRAEADSALAARDQSTPKPTYTEHRQSIGVFYQAQLFSPKIALAQGPGLRWSLARPTRAGDVGLGVSGQYILPQDEVRADVGATLQTVALRLGAGLRERLGSLAYLAAWLGGGVDAVHVKPRQGQLGVATLTSAHWNAVTVLRAELRATVLLGRRLGLSLASSVEWDPVKRHYDVSGIDGTAAVVQPYTVRPGLSLALEWP
jgi:hypothetical protein